MYILLYYITTNIYCHHQIENDEIIDYHTRIYFEKDYLNEIDDETLPGNICASLAGILTEGSVINTILGSVLLLLLDFDKFFLSSLTKAISLKL